MDDTSHSRNERRFDSVSGHLYLLLYLFAFFTISFASNLLDEVYTLDSNELSEEIAALQQRAMDLATELAKA